MEYHNLKLYRSTNYPINGIKQECFVSYIYQNGIYIMSEHSVEKIIQKPTFILDDSTVDNYVLSRGFDKVLEFDKSKLTWFNGYGDTLEKKEYIKLKVNKFKKFIRNISFDRVLSNDTALVTYSCLNTLENHI